MSLLESINLRWNALASRERTLVAAAAWLVAASLLWWIALAPALQTLKAADAQHQVLDGQLQTMLALKAQATSLQSQAKAGDDDTRRRLEQSVKQSLGGAAVLQVAGDRATVSLRGVSGSALSLWLVDLRAGPRLLPAELRLTRAAAAAAGPTPTAPVLWDGSVVLNLAPR